MKRRFPAFHRHTPLLISKITPPKTKPHQPTIQPTPPPPIKKGIVFSVRPPKKSWKHIANLSGGEKTLSSLALVFALHHYKPTPLYVMDEIDAALDFKNVSIGRVWAWAGPGARGWAWLGSCWGLACPGLGMGCSAAEWSGVWLCLLNSVL